MADPACCSCGNCPDCGFVARDGEQAVGDPARFAHGAIRQRLLSRIVSTEIEGRRALARLTTRDPSDPTIALIDSWAGALHVLGWNARRLHEDGNFHQSEDREAMAAHAAMLGYVPRPVLAAQTVQSFTVDQFSPHEGPFEVPQGTKVASVPLGDDLPQIFETDEMLEAWRPWNRIEPVRYPDPQVFNLATTEMLIEGSAPGLQAGDTLVLPDSAAGNDSVLWARAAAVEALQLENGTLTRTRVSLTDMRRLQPVPANTRPAADELVMLGKRASVFGAGAPEYQLLFPSGESTGFSARMISSSAPSPGRSTPIDFETIEEMGENLTNINLTKTQWDKFVIAAPPAYDTAAGRFDLDAEYAEALPGLLLLFDAGTPGGTGNASGEAPRWQLGQIETSEVLNRSDFALSQKVTRVEVDGLSFAGTLPGDGYLNHRVRESTVLLETHRWKLAVPLLDEALPCTGQEDRLLLAGEHHLPPGRLVTINGADAGSPAGSEDRAEVAIVLSAEVTAAGQTMVVFEAPLANRYWSSTLGVQANCVTASHAETGAGGQWEVVGSGPRGVFKPAFALKQAPLAHLPATNERGYAPAIEVRVDGRRYERVDSLYGVDPAEPRYTVEPAADGASQIRFAGVLPSGLNNVMAYYRVGGGEAGNLDAGRITTILSPVVGISFSENLVRAEGGMEAERLDDIRASAPRSVAALGRVVSRNDYEAFARGFRGVGKALATHLQDGMRPIVCLTVATTDMEPPVAGSTLLAGLAEALDLATPPGQNLRVEAFDDETVTLVAALKVDESAWRRRDVEQAVRELLAERFGREAMQFGQPMRTSEILAAIHEVPGIVAALIEALDSASTVAGLPDIPARVPSFDPLTGDFRPASLLALDNTSISFTEMA